jgi:drug/metabolite transporter (DMT)-like permease
LIAIIGGAFAFLLFFDGLKLTTSGRAAFLQKTMPIYIMVLAFAFLKEKITKKHVFSILLMLAGSAVIYFSQIPPSQMWSNPSLGDLMVIGATILWAIENVLSRKAMLNKESNFIVTFVRMFFGGLIIFSLVILMGKYEVILSLSLQQMANIGISTLVLFGYVLFWYWSLKMINVSKASMLLLMSPVISLAVGALLLREPVPALQLVGSALIMIGAYVVSKVRSEFQTI